MGSARHIPEATVARLPRYLEVLETLAAAGTSTVSSERLAELADVRAASLRRDLSHLGSYGVRGVGYDVAYLRREVAGRLGLDRPRPVVIVGVGNLGLALASHHGFAARGFPLLGLVDADPAKIGRRLAGLVVRPPEVLGELVAGHPDALGVVATPSHAAQEALDRLVAAGVRAVLSFAATAVTVPEGVLVRRVDLSRELQILVGQRALAGTLSLGPAS